MATRATIAVYDDRRQIVQIYHHYDGYIDGLGYRLKQYLQDTNTGNNQHPGDLHKDFNGAGCFAASLIAFLKECPGNVYVEPTDTIHGDTEFHYDIFYNSSTDIKLTVVEVYHEYPKIMFERSSK